ncbi:MAG: type II toxin-antitoxin system prevent-host-death family antitoxin [Spirochaetes bacterium]|nr:type II toxin-antitoxin system prevent-host-death family antitoxin [Spirochaetota bacterium]
MEITTKELRIQPGKIIDQVVNGHEITVTFRGKALARIVPIIKKATVEENEEISIFGMWKAHSDECSVEGTVREIRKGRQF